MYLTAQQWTLYPDQKMFIHWLKEQLSHLLIFTMFQTRMSFFFGTQNVLNNLGALFDIIALFRRDSFLKMAFELQFL